MTRIFSSLVLACLALFLCAALSALRGGEAHALLGLAAAIFAVLCHALLLIYLIGTGRTLKAAVETAVLDSSFVFEWRRDLARAIAPAGLGTLAVTAAAVVAGFADPWAARGLHPSLAILTFGATAWALARELVVVASNRERMRRASARIVRAPSGAEAPRPSALHHVLFLAGLTALGVYPYARFVAREARAPVLPFVPLGALLVLGGLLLRRRNAVR